MRCHLHPDREAGTVCPDCGNPVCTECANPEGRCRRCAAERSTGAAVAEEPSCRKGGRGFRDLSLPARFLAVYVLVVGVIAGIPWGIGCFGDFTQTALGWLGVAAGVLMMMAKPAGWWLGLLWALAQALEVIVGGHAVNHQCLYLGGHLSVNGVGLGINLVGVILVVLSLAVRRQFLQESAEAGPFQAGIGESWRPQGPS
jgi:hypothetical protein